MIFTSESHRLFFGEHVNREPVYTVEELEVRVQDVIATVAPEMLVNVQGSFVDTSPHVCADWWL